MKVIRLTKEFRFEMAHALWNYDGLCKNLHGHSYILSVTVIGKPLDNSNHPKFGMVMDFGELKAIVYKEILEPLDHSVLVYKDAPVADLKNLPQMTERFFALDYQPTCENLLIDFASRIRSQLPRGIHLHSLKLHETSSSYAEWYASDQDE